MLRLLIVHTHASNNAIHCVGLIDDDSYRMLLMLAFLTSHAEQAGRFVNVSQALHGNCHAAPCLACRAYLCSGVFIAHVKWYNHVSNARDAMSSALGCPIFKTSFKDDDTCHLYPVEKIAPCQLSAVYQKGQKDRLVILSRFANFLDTTT